MRRLVGIVGIVGIFGIVGFLQPIPAHADNLSLTLRFRHFLFAIPVEEIYGWRSNQDVWTYRGVEIRPPAELLVDGDSIPTLPSGMEHHTVAAWDEQKIARSLTRDIAPEIDEQGGNVMIAKSSTGITFAGVGFPGRTLEIAPAAKLIHLALEGNIPDVILPVTETAPTVTVKDDELKSLGIQNLVAFGESDFSGSTPNRRHNIRTGLKRFNGVIVPKGSTFSFVKILGPVNERTGYEKELTILGDRTLPDFGGGLCQVSTTAYRGVWEAGFPITARRNHSYVVHYYSPVGTDATIYPPAADMSFTNDSSGALLIQTLTDGNKAYFLYYGTPLARTSQIIGPYTWDPKDPPGPRYETTTEIPIGTERVVGKATPGIKAMWFRITTMNGKQKIDVSQSWYEARPLFTQTGVAGSGATAPDWLGVDPGA